MDFRVGLENNVEGRSLAWVLGYPGCFVYGPDGKSALESTSVAIREYEQWIKDQGYEPWFDCDTIEIHLEETWEVYAINKQYEIVEEGYDVEAWFQHDWKPLTENEIERGIQLLNWTRRELLFSIKDMSPQDLEQSFPGERWNYEGILKHVAGAEWWYLDRLGLAFPQQQMPPETFDRLEMVRGYFLETLSKLANSRQVVGTDGEFWSPRKMLRRAVWHERDHIGHILKLRSWE